MALKEKTELAATAQGDWRAKYSKRLRLVDGGVVIWAVAGAFGARFGFPDENNDPTQDFNYVFLSAALIVAWWLMLGYWGSRAVRLLGSGSEEYRRVLASSAWLFGFVALISYALRIDTARGFVGLAFPAGAFGLLVGRWMLRQHLSIERRQGRSTFRVLIIGGTQSAAHLVRSLKSVPAAGYLPVASHVPVTGVSSSTDDPEVPLLVVQSDFDSILNVILRTKVDAVAVSAGSNLHPQNLRRLGWELAARDIAMILAPALTDVAGPRIHTQQVAGLPLIHVTTPTLEGGQRVAKRLFDVAAAALLLSVASPAMLVVALLIKLDSPGPVLFRQERVGLEGNRFSMFKFRSMGLDAEALRSELHQQNEGSGPLFKMRNDPRVTRVGALLRRFSIDELPQLINVLSGSMSLVGPRPPLPQEVEAYESDVRRRLLVKPGLTGLWQVSGRSNLSWQDSVRLDLYYVENWSLAGDLVILVRTVRAVFGRTGAY